MKTEQLRSTVESVITALLHSILQFPQQLEMKREFEGGSMTIWNLRCNGADRGRVIGKGGERFSALRVIAQLIGARHKHQCKLGELMPSPPAVSPPPVKFTPNPNWPREEVITLARAVGQAVFGPQTEIGLTAAGHTAVIQFLIAEPITSTERQAAQLALDNVFAAMGTSLGADLSIDLS
jgi:predicted RNA-binding protein YlqC (UPF0109 family)